MAATKQECLDAFLNAINSLGRGWVRSLGINRNSITIENVLMASLITDDEIRTLSGLRITDRNRLIRQAYEDIETAETIGMVVAVFLRQKREKEISEKRENRLATGRRRYNPENIEHEKGVEAKFLEACCVATDQWPQLEKEGIVFLLKNYKKSAEMSNREIAERMNVKSYIIVIPINNITRIKVL